MGGRTGENGPHVPRLVELEINTVRGHVTTLQRVMAGSRALERVQSSGNATRPPVKVRVTKVNGRIGKIDLFEKKANVSFAFFTFLTRSANVKNLRVRIFRKRHEP